VGSGIQYCGVTIGCGILAPIGIILDPAVGAIVMALSTVIVALNAMSLTADKIKSRT
jgi:Cu2+-exporting ATPase